MTRTLLITSLLAFLLSSPAVAGPEAFETGPVIEGYGPVAKVEGASPVSKDAIFRVTFDSAKAAETDGLNRTLESAARFINMHAAVGVDPDNIDVAVIVHGAAAFDLLNAEAFSKANEGATNATAPLIAALVETDVRILLCGQTAAYRDINTSDLLPGVEVALSAMTAHAQLQREGYTLNPF